jgi:LysR family pca operon transcriptional activator
LRRYLDQQLKLSHLRAIDAIVMQKSLLKAAQAIGVSQPALTKCVKELEDIFGVQLFERHGRGVTPTLFGSAVAQSAKRIMAELRRLDEELDQLASHSSGTIVLGALPVPTYGLVPDMLARFKLDYPDLKVRVVMLRTDKVLASLAAGDVDLVIGRLYELAAPDGFAREALYEEPFSVLARADHPIFARNRIEPEDLAAYDFVLPTMSQRIGQEIEHFLATHNLHPVASLRASSTGFIREMLHSTDYITITARRMMAGDLRRGSIREVPLAVVAKPRPAGLIYRRDRPLMQNAQTLASFIRAYLGNLPAAHDL